MQPCATRVNDASFAEDGQQGRRLLYGDARRRGDALKEWTQLGGSLRLLHRCSGYLARNGKDRPLCWRGNRRIGVQHTERERLRDLRCPSALAATDRLRQPAQDLREENA